jgi:hypothetical protein
MAEEGLMANVHPDGDRGLAAVATEAPGSDKEAEQESLVELVHGSTLLTWGYCYTVW